MMKRIINSYCLAMGVMVTLFSFSSCLNDSDIVDEGNQAFDTEKIPLDFDWKASRNITVNVKSATTTKVSIFSDKEFSRLLCCEMLTADEVNNIPLTVSDDTNVLYMSYVSRNGGTTVKVLDLQQSAIATRASEEGIIVEEIDDAAEIVAHSSEYERIAMPNSREMGTIFFEDKYPEVGDYDMNDFVLGYNIDYTNDSRTETLVIKLQIRAVGGSLAFVPGLEIKGGVKMADISSIFWTSTDSRLSVENLSAEGTNLPPVLLVKGTSELKDETGFFNTKKRIKNESELPIITITIERNRKGGETKLNKSNMYNLFIYNTVTKVEIHEKNQKATIYASNKNDVFKDEKNNVWAISFPKIVPHTYENIHISKAFAHFNKWLMSSGENAKDWTDSFDKKSVIEYGEDKSDSEAEKPSISISESVVRIPAEGGKIEVPVDANVDYDVYVGEQGWIYDFQQENGKLVLFAQNNFNSTEKTAIVTLVAKNHSSVSCSFTVSQASIAYSGAMIKTNGEFASKMKTLAVNNGASAEDIKRIVFVGHSEKYKETNGIGLPKNVIDIRCGRDYEHVYAEWDTSTGTVSISTPGSVINSGNTCSYMFNLLQGLETVDFSGLETSQVTNMSYMFNKCSSLKSVDLRPLNTLNVNNMSNLFSNCSSLTEVKIGCTKTALYDADAEGNGCTYRLFENCSSLKEIDLSTFDFADVKTLNATFIGCKALEKVLFGKNNTSKIVMLKRTFQQAGNGNFECKNADFSSLRYIPMTIFEGGTNITSVDFSGWKTPNLETMNSVFSGCSNAKRINISGWSGEKISKMDRTFNGCALVEEIDFGWNFNIPETAFIDYIFYCTAATSKNTVVKCSQKTADLLLPMKDYNNNSRTFIRDYAKFEIY